MESSLFQVAATALVNLSLAWIVGVLASRLWLMTGTARWQEPAIKRLSFAMTASLASCAISIVLSLWTEAAVMGDVAWLDAGPAFSAVLASTHYGHAGLAALGALVLAMAAHRRLAHTRAGMRYVGTITALVLVVAAARVSIGHAFEHGPMSTAAWMELLHILCMSLWAGVVFVAGWVVLPCVLANAAASDKARAGYLKSLSAWATAALAGVLATGVYNAYRVLGSPRELIEGDYGHILVFKLCFVLVAIALGGLNRFHYLPAAVSLQGPSMETQRALRAVIAILRVESIALLFVLAAAAALTGSAPPG